MKSTFLSDAIMNLLHMQGLNLAYETAQAASNEAQMGFSSCSDCYGSCGNSCEGNCVSSTWSNC